ncbi:MAG: DUF192 domain-containing protein [Clostridiales bacterium]|jgi:uncharacterized membrane protein (UPF0127 family)|nr:DUF192 domain-containing protein [Clostridiales bacterium]
MKLLQLEKDGVVLIPHIENADGCVSRMMGLMFRKSLPEDRGLLLEPCRQIHTFQMKFPIDAVYISKENVIIKIEESILPGQTCKKVKAAQKVLELCGGTAKKIGLAEEDKVCFSKAEE